MKEVLPVVERKTREKINKIFEICKERAMGGANPCRCKCDVCKLSDEYEKISGIRLEDIQDD